MQERERQILHCITYMWNSKTNSQKQKKSGCQGLEKLGEAGKKIQTISYKINKV